MTCARTQQLCGMMILVLLALGGPLETADFIRGDVDGLGSIEITDAIRTLGYLFLGSPTSLDCEDAADSNDDGLVNIGDAVFTLNFLFSGGQAPPAPAGACGPDPTDDALSCKAFAACETLVSGALINEVFFNPLPDEMELAELRAQFPWLTRQFVELKLTGAPLGALSLQNQNGDVLVLPAVLPAITAEGILLILFDGLNQIETGIVHAGIETFLNPVSGSVSLLDDKAALLDKAEWGDDRPDGIRLFSGGVGLEALPGVAVARLPQSTQEDSPAAWMGVIPADSTPGKPNSSPRVEAFFPQDGSIEIAGDISISWLLAPGAAQYHLQVAEASMPFDSLLADLSVSSSPVTVHLGAGEYHVRMQAVFSNDAVGAWNEHKSLVVVNSLDEIRDAGEGGGGAAINGRILESIPPKAQRKDTRMLLLQSNFPTGSKHAWDAPHIYEGETDAFDPSDSCYCSLASISVINAYYAQAKGLNGTLSQDRIGFEIHRSKGPNEDMVYGNPFNGPQIKKALTFALGNPPTSTPLSDAQRIINSVTGQYNTLIKETFWDNLKISAISGKPVMIVVPGHAEVAVGWEQTKAKGRLVHLNDSWTSQRKIVQLDTLDVRDYWVMPDSVAAARDEPALDPDADADNDGIIDFDEDQRFKTRWKDPKSDKDSDGDCLEDLDEIRRSVFDRAHGWGQYFTGVVTKTGSSSDGRARKDLNGRKPPELNPDSDGGGVPDYLEWGRPGGIAIRNDQDDGGMSPYDSSDDLRLALDGTEENIFDMAHLTTDDPSSPYTQIGYRQRITTEFHLVPKPSDEDPDHLTLEGPIKIHLDAHQGVWPFKDPSQCTAPSLIQTAPEVDLAGIATVTISHVIGDDGNVSVYFNGGMKQLTTPFPERFITETLCNGVTNTIAAGGLLFDDTDYGSITDIRAHHQGGPLIEDEYDYTAQLVPPGGYWTEGTWTHHLHVKLTR